MEVKVGDIMECKKRCIIAANCLSVNILTNADRGFACQLNSALKENANRRQFVQHVAGEYYGLKKRGLCKRDGKTCDNVTPWYAFNQSYFQYVRTPLDHFEANRYCQEQYGALVSISSEDEHTFLFETFIKPDTRVTNFVHIGMNDIAEEGVYVWDDGSPVTQIRFAPYEPNNLHNEDCMTIWPGNGGFNDFSCTGLCYFICEADYGTLTHS